MKLPTNFNKYLWFQRRVYLDMKEWGYDGVHEKGKVIF